MQLMEAETTEFLEEFVGGTVILANSSTTRGPVLVRGKLMEVFDKDSRSMTIKHTIEAHAFGTLDDDADHLTWHESTGIATWTTLQTKHWVEDDGTLFFGEPTPSGNTAHIIAPVAAATAA